MENRTNKIKIDQSGFAGIFWIAGWLFSIGYLQLTFFKGLLAIFIWPYYLGVFFHVAK